MYCAQVRDQFGLTMPVLYDPEGLSFQYGAHDTATIVSEDGTIVYKEQYGDQNTEAAVLDELVD